MPYLFDSDAISEGLRRVPIPLYLEWLQSIPLEHQYTSTVVVAELYRGAYRRLPAQPKFLQNVQNRVLLEFTILPFELETAKIYGQINAELERIGQPLAHADLQIAATAIQYNYELVTGNLRHFSRVPGLIINPALANARNP